MWESSASDQLLMIATCCNWMQMPSTWSFLQKTGKLISSYMLIAFLSKLPNKLGRQYLLATSDWNDKPPSAGKLGINPGDPWLYFCALSHSNLVGLGWTQGCAGFMPGFREALFEAELACRDRANEWEMHELYVAYSHLHQVRSQLYVYGRSLIRERKKYFLELNRNPQPGGILLNHWT